MIDLFATVAAAAAVGVVVVVVVVYSRKGKEFGRYPAILTSCLVNNAYISPYLFGKLYQFDPFIP